MRRQNMVTESDMNRQVLGYPNLNSSICFGNLPAFPLTSIPTLTAPVNIPNHGNAMSYATGHYYGASHHHPILDVGIAAAPIFCGSSQIASHGPPSQLPPPSNHGVPASVQYQGSNQFMHNSGGAHKIKNAEGIMGTAEFLNTQSAPSSSIAAGHLPIPELGSQQNVSYRLDMNPVLVPGQNNLIPGTCLVQPSLPPGCVWLNQQLSNGGVLTWCQPPPIPYMHVFPGPFGVNPGHYSFIHHPPHLPISLGMSVVYPHISLDPSTGFTSYVHHLGQTSMVAPARHPNLPHLRLMPADGVALLEVGDFSGVGFHSDQHENMRLDIEHMSYEELLALSEGIGSVNTGLSQAIIENSLKTITYPSSKTKRKEASSRDQETNACIICQENYKNREKIGTLDCGHDYHADCLKKWLIVKNVCPICKSVALAPKKEHH